MAPEMSRTQSAADMVRLGKSLVAQLFVLVKTSFNYSEGHAALATPVERVLDVVREIQHRTEDATLRVKGNHLFLSDYRLKPDAAGFEAARFVMEEMRRRMLGRISFSEEVTAEELRSFVYALREADEVASADPYHAMLERMQRRGIRQIEVETLADEAEPLPVDRERLNDDRLKARLIYHRAIVAMEEVMAGVAVGQPLRLRECKRVVQQLIDLLATRHSYLLGLTARRCHHAYGENHAANVCILSLAIGKRLGMSKFHLCELGMAALFHDIGKADLPPEILNKEGELDPRERQALEAHPLLGVRKVLKLKALDVMTARIVTGVFEHHLLADYSGYPRLSHKRVSLFGRIISIADGYDVLTSSRVGTRKSFAPDKAMRFLLTRGGKEYDQALLKIFLGCVGLYGMGSLVLLDSGELAVVVENNPDPAAWDAPRVRIIADAAGRELDGEAPQIVDARPPRGVAATVDPSLFDLDVSRYLV